MQQTGRETQDLSTNDERFRLAAVDAPAHSNGALLRPKPPSRQKQWLKVGRKARRTWVRQYITKRVVPFAITALKLLPGSDITSGNQAVRE